MLVDFVLFSQRQAVKVPYKAVSALLPTFYTVLTFSVHSFKDCFFYIYFLGFPILSFTVLYHFFLQNLTWYPYI